MAFEIKHLAFSPWDEIAAYQQRMERRGRYGATTSFVGTMRDFNQDAEVRDMTLEHYPGMTERYLEKIESRVRRRWDIVDTVIIHRVGHIEIADAIVLICVWSAHREVSFAACRFMIEELKSKAPFWKLESTAQGKRWVTQGA